MKLLTLSKHPQARRALSRSHTLTAHVADKAQTLTEESHLMPLLADIRAKEETGGPLEIFVKNTSHLYYDTLRFSALSLEEINNPRSRRPAENRHFWSSLVKYNSLVAIIAYALYDDEIIGKEILQMSTAEIEQVVKNKIGR